MASLLSPLRALVAPKAPAAALAGLLLTLAALWLIPNALGSTSRWLAAWDIAILFYLATLVLIAAGATPARMAKRAAEADEGRLVLLGVSLLAVIISVVAVAAELGIAKSADVPEKQIRVVFAFVTVALSWQFVHAAFASNHAHEHYGPAGAATDATRGGLDFPKQDENQKPDFWDFIHFALVIGVANQTADVCITSRTLRNIVTLHGVAAFLFNTVILALTINLAANLFP